MEFLASSMAYFGFAERKIKQISPDIGIEIVSEFGSRFHWDRWIPILMAEREGKLSVHGPFLGMELADRTSNFECYLEEYKEAFDISAANGAIHCVVHSHSQFYTEDPVILSDAQKCCTERLYLLNELAKKMDVNMVVENLVCTQTPKHRLLLEQEDFLKLMDDIPDIKYVLDVGHAVVSQWDLEHVIKKAADHISAYHIHDNDGNRDLHLQIGEGTINWDWFRKLYNTYTPNANIVFEYNFADAADYSVSKAKFLG